MEGSLGEKDPTRQHSDLSLEMVQLLVSRLFHDLSGPAGALANGVEMAMEGQTLDPAVGDLLNFSAVSLLGRLRFLGAAFGRVDLSDAVTLAPIAEAAHRYLKDRPRLSLEFPAVPAPSGFASLLAILVVVASGCLPKEGEIKVCPGTDQDPWRVTAAGPTLRLEPGFLALLEGGEAPISSRSVIAILASRLASQLGWWLKGAEDRHEELARLTIVIGKSASTNTET